MVTRSTAKSATAARASKATTKATAAAATINRKSLTVGVGRRSSFADITRQLERQLKEAGCQRCLSGLERLILDSRVNPQ